MSKYHNDDSYASDPGGVHLADEKLRRLEPQLYGWRSWFYTLDWDGDELSALELRGVIDEHLMLGDSRAAFVIRTEPTLLVAAYTDEQDAVLVLRFPAFLVDEHGLRPGKKLLTVNTYGYGPVQPDIVEGPASTGQYGNYYPLIAEFLSDDMDAIQRRKQSIDDAEWQRAVRLTKRLLASRVVGIRDGRPLHSNVPVQPEPF